MISLEYAAGLFDGEGTIGVYYYASRHYYVVRVALGTIYSPILEEFRERWGGGISLYKGRHCGKLPLWTWYLSGKHCARFLSEVYPFLREKRNRAAAALLVLDTLRWKQERGAYHGIPHDVLYFRQLAIRSRPWSRA